jgi:hypothetical protein
MPFLAALEQSRQQQASERSLGPEYKGASHFCTLVFQCGVDAQILYGSVGLHPG